MITLRYAWLTVVRAWIRLLNQADEAVVNGQVKRLQMGKGLEAGASARKSMAL